MFILLVVTEWVMKKCNSVVVFFNKMSNALTKSKNYIYFLFLMVSNWMISSVLAILRPWKNNRQIFQDCSLQLQTLKYMHVIYSVPDSAHLSSWFIVWILYVQIHNVHCTIYIENSKYKRPFALFWSSKQRI